MMTWCISCGTIFAAEHFQDETNCWEREQLYKHDGMRFNNMQNNGLVEDLGSFS